MTCLRVGRATLRGARARVQRILLTPRALDDSAAPLARNCCTIGRRCDIAHFRPVRCFAITWVTRQHAVVVQQVDIAAAIASCRHVPRLG